MWDPASHHIWYHPDFTSRSSQGGRWLCPSLGLSPWYGRYISKAIGEKTAVLKRVGERFVALSAHDAFILLRHSFTIPKLQYLLRTAPCYQSEALVEYDNTLQYIMGKVTNTAVDKAWKQASLPVKLSGLGVGSAVEVAHFAACDFYPGWGHSAGDLYLLQAKFAWWCPFTLIRGSLLSTSCGCWCP